MPWVTQEEAARLNIPHTTLQTLELPKSKFTLAGAKHWLKMHNYANHYYRPTAHYWRFLQTPPIIGSHYYSKKIANGIIIVHQTYDKGSVERAMSSMS